ncbi:MAG: M48 family metalloprotease [Methanobrevibacter sp.]|nr:M48 family metalloprotease [Methanobrevibacter sp.]
MRKNDRSSINPFTGKEHFDRVDDDKFLASCFQGYYQEIQRSQLLDNTREGQFIIQIAVKLIKTVEEFLTKIGRHDYVENYYEWDVHLVANNAVNACCMPGGKIIVYSGIFSIANTEERMAFILAHEMAHALLDHGRTRASAQSTKDGIANAAMIGSLALDLMGLGAIGELARAATQIANMGSQFFLMQPWGRDQEFEADKLGMFICHLAGYDIREVPKFWREFSGGKGNNFDFFSTHPSDDKRIAVMVESEQEILSTTDFYSKPLMPETPKAKAEYSDSNQNKPNPQPNQPQNTAPAPNQAGRTCPKCGAVSSPEDKFCTNCGNKFE